MRAPVICIDGPAGSGKTTIARALAEKLGYFYLDTGVLYRAVTWVALRRGIRPDDAPALADLARRTTIDVRPAPPGDPRQTIVLAAGEDVSLAIRTTEVDGSVSEVSAHQAVREALLGVQRSEAARGGVILAGRDMGTVVWPESEVKIYLIASLEERARRRVRQAAEQGLVANAATALADLRRRDEYDSGRAVAPLRPADDAVTVDSTEMGVDQVVAAILEAVRARTGVAAQPTGNE